MMCFQIVYIPVLKSDYKILISKNKIIALIHDLLVQTCTETRFVWDPCFLVGGMRGAKIAKQLFMLQSPNQ